MGNKLSRQFSQFNGTILIVVLAFAQLFLGNDLYAQDKSKIVFEERASSYIQEGELDSAEKYMILAIDHAKSRNDTSKVVELLFNLGESFSKDLDTIKAFYYHREPLRLFGQKYASQSYRYIIRALFFSGNAAKSETYLDSMLVAALSSKDSNQIAQCYLASGWFRINLNQGGEAAKVLLEGLPYAQFKPGIFRALAHVYQHKLFNDKKALEYLLKYTESQALIGDTAGIINSCLVMGNYYFDKDPDEAIKYFNKGLEYLSKDQIIKTRASLLFNLGAMQEKKGAYEVALDNFSNGSVISEKVGYHPTHAMCECGLGRIFFKEGKIEKAIIHFEKCQEVFEQRGLVSNKNEPYFQLARIYSLKQNFSKAERYIDEAYSNINNSESSASRKELIDLYTTIKIRKNKIHEAFSAMQLYMAQSDSLNNKQITRQAERMLAEYEFQSERDSLQYASDRERIILNEEVKRQKSRQQIALIGGVMVFVFLVILWFLYQAKRRTNRKLENTLQRLKTTQEQLIQSEKLASIGQLTAGIAHEINNPVNFIQASSTALKQDLRDLLELKTVYRNALEESDVDLKPIDQFEEQLGIEEIESGLNQSLQDILEGSERTSKIVEGLRSFSRKETEEMVDTNIEEGFLSTLNLVKSRLNAEVKVNTNFASDARNVKAHPNQLNQVFLNLLVNALDAMDGEGEINVSSRLLGKDVEITFSDNGPGMTKEVLSKIFDPFFTTKDVGEGTGLGLSISHGIISSHGGDIYCKSIIGKGTTFYITLKRQ